MEPEVMLVVLLHMLSSSGAVTLTGSSEYAVPGTEFTLTCDVPEEANAVQFYRLPDVATSEGSVRVAGGQCYNTISNPVPCTANVCSCVTSGGNLGTVFRWIIQPQTGDQGSVWYCSRTNLNLPIQILDSDNYTIHLADGPGTSIALSPPDTNYTRTEGDTLPDITCTADCRPDCTFVWTRPNNTNFTVSPVLSLGQLDRSEHGKYRCTARNVAGETTITSSIIVQYGPSTVRLTPPTVTYTSTEGQTLPIITCSADCNPACTYSWTKDGQSFTTGSGLHLTNIQRGQTGVYRCTASNVHGSTTAVDVSVTVYYGPGTSLALSPPDTTYTTTEGDTLPDITCTADCRPDCTFVWTRPDNTNFTVSPVLSLGQLDRSEHGTYRCTARNDVGESTFAMSIIVQYGPGNSVALSPPDTNYTRTEGDTLPDITCTANCRPDCTFVWTRPDNTNFTVSPVLSLGQLDRSEHGTYICTARNVVGETTATTSVILNFGPSTVSLTPPTVTYTPTEGQTNPTITCYANCNPACTYSWTKDGQSYTTGSGLHLTNIQRGQTGVYMCTASNGHGSATAVQVDINVNYGPGTSTALSPPDTTYTRTEGDTLPDITCTADCRPGCTFVWTRPDNTNFTVSPVLSLGQLDRSEHGTYRCTARNVVGESTLVSSVTVEYGPGTSIAPRNTTYTRTEGDTLPEITCTAACIPDCTFVWTRPDNTNFTVSPLLSLGQLDRSEHGTYRCTSRNRIGESTTIINVTIQYGPGMFIALSPPDTTYTRTEGDTLPDITCTADCRPDCTFVWTRPDKTNFTVSPVLSLGQLDRSEHGTYSCTARNAVGESFSTTDITVQFPPSIENVEFTKGDGNLPEGSSASLICTVDSLPLSTIQWFYKANGTVLLTSPNVLESTYTLTNAGCLDTGLYTCSVRNSVSTTAVTRDIPINVLCKPREDPRINAENTFRLSISDDLAVTAHFLANPMPSFRWEFQNTSFVNETELFNGTNNFQTYNSYDGTNLSAVSIGIRSDIQEHWYGTYDVTANNSQGIGRIRFIVKAQGKPNPPYGESVICPFQDRAFFIWRSGFDGGSNQSFVVGRKTGTQDAYLIDSSSMLSDPGQHKTTNMSFFGLEADTQYFFIVYAVNKFGNSSIANEVNCTTKADPAPEVSKLGAILGAGGGSVAAIIVCVIVVVIVIMKRRKNGKHNRDDDTEMITSESPSDSSDGLKPNILYESSNGLKANVLYESSGPQPGTSSEYAVVQKNLKPKPISPNDVYAVVNKSKKDNSEAKDDVYAEVDKTKTKGGKGGKGAKAGKNGKGKRKKGDTKKKAEDVYENVEGIDTASDNIYSNCEEDTTPVTNKVPSRKTNKDGLIYLDIEFKEDKQNGRNYVIHGIENRTDYADVDFTKRAGPLPSDDEANLKSD